MGSHADDEEAQRLANDPFQGNDPFLTHAAGIDRPPPTMRKRTQGKQETSVSDILIIVGLVLGPWLLFVALSCLFTFAYHKFYDVVWIVVFFCLIFSVVPIGF